MILAHLNKSRSLARSRKRDDLDDFILFLTQLVICDSGLFRRQFDL